MKFCNLASGSKGNCTYVESENTAVLIDDGISLKELEKRANLSNIDLNKVSALFVTHEHCDHIGGIASFSKKYKVNIYGPDPSMDQLYDKNVDGHLLHLFDCVNGIKIDDMNISSFRLPHDAIYTQGYILESQGKKIVLSTDLGYISKATFEKYKGADLIYLESNYDEEMLKNGPYPFYLKKRILGNNGHLCNTESARAVAALKNEGVERFVLAHLSENNNTKDKVTNTLSQRLDMENIKLGSLELTIADQYIPSEVLKI